MSGALPTLAGLCAGGTNSHASRNNVTAALHAGGFTIPCDHCGGEGWIVVNQTMGWPYGEQEQCGRCHDGVLSVGILPAPVDEDALQEAIACHFHSDGHVEIADWIADEVVEVLHAAGVLPEVQP